MGKTEIHSFSETEIVCVCVTFKNKPSSSNPTPLVLNQTTNSDCDSTSRRRCGMEQRRQKEGTNSVKGRQAGPVNVIFIVPK